MKFKLEERFLLTEADTTDPRDFLTGLPDQQLAEQESDWEELYYNCQTQADFTEFWDKYLEATFHKNAAKAKSFLPALASFLSKIKNKDIGWTTEDNSIIALLIGINEGTLPSISIAHLNNGSVRAITIAYLDNILTTEIIQATLKAKGKEYLLACPEFYSLTAADQEQYLKLQKSIDQADKSFFDICINQETNKLLPVKQSKINAKKAGIGTINAQEINPDAVGAQSLKSLGIDNTNASEAFACFYDILRVVSPESIKLAAKNCSSLAKLRNQTPRISLSQIETWYPKFVSTSKVSKQAANAKLLLTIAECAGAKIKWTGA